MDDFWVFGYGSLMWRPGFEFLRQTHARAFGFHRALCISSHIYRGTPERPGLVLGLDRGGSCRGIAFLVSGEKRKSVVAYLRERELVTNAYFERQVPVMLDDGRRVTALTYVVDRDHEQYSGTLSVEVAAATVRGAHGQAGANEDYVLNTVDHLRSVDVRDVRLEAVANALRSPQAAGAS